MGLAMSVCVETLCRLRRYRGLASIENVGRISPARRALDRLATNAARSGGSDVIRGGISRPPMVRDNRHGSVHVFGAICPARRIGAAVVMPVVNTEAMNHHLAEISSQVATGAHALLICDGAGWHQPGERLIVPDNITLMPLPPYAP